MTMKYNNPISINGFNYPIWCAEPVKKLGKDSSLYYLISEKENIYVTNGSAINFLLRTKL